MKFSSKGFAVCSSVRDEGIKEILPFKAVALNEGQNVSTLVKAIKIICLWTDEIQGRSLLYLGL
jgi:hypothetical protein